MSCNEPEPCLFLFSNSKLRRLSAFLILLVLGIHEGLTLCCSLALFLCKIGAGELDCSTMTVIRLNSAFSTGTPHLNISCTEFWSKRSIKVFSSSRYLIQKSWSSMLLKRLVTLRILSINLCREKLIVLNKHVVNEHYVIRKVMTPHRNSRLQKRYSEGGKKIVGVAVYWEE